MRREYIGKKLRRLRKQAGLTQRELARRLGIHWRSVTDYERDVTAVDPYKATAILLIVEKLAAKNKGKGKGKQS